MGSAEAVDIPISKRGQAAAERRSAILECAGRLFFARGYEATTISDIIQETGLSKGGFYHHFASKEELLDAIVERITLFVIDDMKAILEDPALNALEQFNLCIRREIELGGRSAASGRRFLETFLDPENAALYQRLVQVMTDTYAPLIETIVTKGVREGVFAPIGRGIVAEIFMGLTIGRRASLLHSLELADAGKMNEAVDLLAKRLSDEAVVMERLLGVPPGGVDMADRDVLMEFFEIATQSAP